MLRALLAERFNLKLHQETKDLPVYELVIAQNGPKLQEAKPGETYPNGIQGPSGRATAGLIKMGPGAITGQGVPIGSLVRQLTQQLGRNVLDKTGLKGIYDFTLKWSPDASQSPTGSQQGARSPESTESPIFTSIQDQLGLRLVPQQAPVEILVIDHAEQPAQN
jgi:uncharacterized protein (TIGR03435 family)